MGLTLKARVGIATVLLLGAAGVGEACSPETAHPPIDTAGSESPSSTGAGGSESTNDGGSSTSTSDAATDDASDAAVVDTGTITSTGNCTTGNCTGCCDTSGACQSGVLVTACGQLGFACKSCEGGTVCASGFCQP